MTVSTNEKGVDYSLTDLDGWDPNFFSRFIKEYSEGTGLDMILVDEVNSKTSDITDETMSDNTESTDSGDDKVLFSGTVNFQVHHIYCGKQEKEVKYYDFGVPELNDFVNTAKENSSNSHSRALKIFHKNERLQIALTKNEDMGFIVLSTIISCFPEHVSEQVFKKETTNLALLERVHTKVRTALIKIRQQEGESKKDELIPKNIQYALPKLEVCIGEKREKIANREVANREVANSNFSFFSVKKDAEPLAPLPFEAVGAANSFAPRFHVPNDERNYLSP